MSAPTYWLDLFTGKTWQELLDAGGEVTGFRESRWKTVQRIKPSDYLLCYLTGVSRLIGILEVTSEPYQDDSPIWSDFTFSSRMKVKPVVTLTPETAVPIHELRDELSIFQNLKSPLAWTGHLRGSPTKWKKADGTAILNALLEAEANPIHRPVDPKKLARRPRALKTKTGPVTVPESEEPARSTEQQDTSAAPSEHTEIQHPQRSHQRSCLPRPVPQAGVSGRAIRSM